MKASGLILTFAVALVLIPAVPALVPAQPTESLAPPSCDVIATTRLLFYGDDPSDLNGCQQDCRSKFGYDFYSDSGSNSDNDFQLQRFRGGGAGTGTYYAYAQCIADCNNAFWKDFDRKTGDMEK